MKTRISVMIGLVLLTAACATTTTAPRSPFDDIPLPTGLTYQPDRSVLIESPAIKAGQFVYRGRLEPDSLADVMRARAEANGWRPVSRTTTASDGTWQVYEKDGNALEVHIYEELWYTYLAVSTAETRAPAAQTGADTPPASLVIGTVEPKASGSATALDAGAPAAVESATPAEPAAKQEDASFTQKVKHFFTNLFTW
jgi:hypothetical protein